MTSIIKKIINFSTFTLMLSFILLTTATAIEAPYDEMEETAEMIMERDSIIAGKMTDFSRSAIVVDNSSKRLCDEVKIFSPNNHIIQIKDLKGAEDVKLFINRGCVRKIVILRFRR